MKTYTLKVEELFIRGTLYLPTNKRITINVNEKVVFIGEAPDVLFRCSRLKFIDSEGDYGHIQLQTDGLKITFCRDYETLSNISLFRSHVDHVCGITTEQSQKKRSSSSAFDSTRSSPAAERRHHASSHSHSSSSRPYTTDSPGKQNKYQRQIVSSVKKSLPTNTAHSVHASPSVGATHGTPRKKTNSLFGSPKPVNNKNSRKSNSNSNIRGCNNNNSSKIQGSHSNNNSDNYSDIISSVNTDRYDHSQVPKSPSRPQVSGKKPRTSNASPHKVSDVVWCGAFPLLCFDI